MESESQAAASLQSTILLHDRPGQPLQARNATFPGAIQCLAAEHGHVYSLHVIAGTSALCTSKLISSVMLHPVADHVVPFMVHHFGAGSCQVLNQSASCKVMCIC